MPRVGQTATNPKTGAKVKWTGSDWVSVAGAGSAPAAGGGKMSQTAEKFFNELRNQANDAGEAMRIYSDAEKPIKELHPGPNRGRFLEMATPEEGGGVLDTLGGILIGGPARLLGAITPKDTQNYQKLRGYQSQQVLRRQLEQKGPQTESDAARLALTELSPSKSSEVNMDVINKGKARAARAQARAIFYQQFSQKYGLNGKNEAGQTADELWSNNADAITSRLVKSAGGGPKITVISKTKVK